MTSTIEGPCAIDGTVVLGEGCRIWQFTTIGARASLGDRCVIGSCCYVGKNSILGDDVHLNHGVFLPNGSIVGDRVFIGPNATFTDDKHPRVNNPDYQAQPPIIEEDANIGARAVILPGIRLGKGCTIGAGAVVTHDVPAGETWLGIPAKRMHTWPHPPADGGWMRRLEHFRDHH
jgi:UDP-2-acetamido-3-amino-2,3-dideoxy-glucuronate N-acetyltransferase